MAQCRLRSPLLGAILGVVNFVVPVEATRAAEPTERAPGFLTQIELSDRQFRPLFVDGDKKLVNWNASETHQKHWTINDGVIHYDGQRESLSWHDANLWTRESFGDTQFYIEWRFDSKPVLKPHPIVLWNGDFLLDPSGKRVTRMRQDAGDSGILFRGILACQANIWCQELGSGEVNGYRTNQKLPVRLRQSCIPYAYGDNPIGQWNAFLITLGDDRLSVQLNGQMVLETMRLPKLPASGPIGLQHHGDPIQFRNIWVKEIGNNE